jgi:hypothetical protein
MFAEPAEKDGCAVVAVAHSVKEWQWRVIAVDQEGKDYQSVGQSSGSGELWHHPGKFKLPLARVKEFQFQVRPYRWVEFREVALHPRESPVTNRVKLESNGR